MQHITILIAYIGYVLLIYCIFLSGRIYILYTKCNGWGKVTMLISLQCKIKSMSNINNPLPCILINRSRNANYKIMLCNDIIHNMLINLDIRRLHFKYRENPLVQIVFFILNCALPLKLAAVFKHAFSFFSLFLISVLFCELNCKFGFT